MALLMCVAQPGMSFCDIDDFAAVISCIAAVLLSPSGIFVTAASALAMPSAEQPAVFDLARAGAAASAVAARAAKTVLKIMLVPRNRSRRQCRFRRNVACRSRFRDVAKPAAMPAPSFRDAPTRVQTRNPEISYFRIPGSRRRRAPE